MTESFSVALFIGFEIFLIKTKMILFTLLKHDPGFIENILLVYIIPKKTFLQNYFS